MYNGQMEMSFEHGFCTRNRTRRQRRLARASWWFQCMRQVVDRAIDWQPAPPPRPEQTWFPGAHREIELAPAVAEQQVCE